jgi:hypothetical protein
MDAGWTVEFLNDIAEAEFDQLPIEIKAKIVRISQLIEQVGLFSVKNLTFGIYRTKFGNYVPEVKKNLPDHSTPL